MSFCYCTQLCAAKLLLFFQICKQNPINRANKYYLLPQKDKKGNIHKKTSAWFLNYAQASIPSQGSHLLTHYNVIICIDSVLSSVSGFSQTPKPLILRH